MFKHTRARLVSNGSISSFGIILLGAIGGCSISAALMCFPFPSSQVKHRTSHSPSHLSENNIVSSSTKLEVEYQNKRTYASWADIHYRKTKELPKPQVIHASLEDLIRTDSRQQGLGTRHQNDVTIKLDKILVIGDVHGCLSELALLVEKAVNEGNKGHLFDAIILVGDLVNKGPLSAEVIKFVREQRGWFTVRGNHDDSALRAALGDDTRRGKMKYQWLQSEPLSDQDILWMTELPYTISIPSKMWRDQDLMSDDVDTVIVHAGLVPKKELFEQDVLSMTTIREVIESDDKSSYAHYIRGESSNESEHHDPLPWAQVWSKTNETTLVIFGHDAKKKLQNMKNAIGLDTGAVYGGSLTGCILPNRIFISVPASKRHHLV